MSPSLATIRSVWASPVFSLTNIAAATDRLERRIHSDALLRALLAGAISDCEAVVHQQSADSPAPKALSTS